MLTSCNAKKSCFVISFIGFNFILQESRELIYRKKDDFTGFFHSSKDVLSLTYYYATIPQN